MNGKRIVQACAGFPDSGRMQKEWIAIVADIIASEGAVALGDHQRAAHPRRGFTLRSKRFEDSMETGEMES